MCNVPNSVRKQYVSVLGVCCFPFGSFVCLAMSDMLSDDVKLSLGICERCTYVTLLLSMVVGLSPGRVLVSLAARGCVQCEVSSMEKRESCVV